MRILIALILALAAAGAQAAQLIVHLPEEAGIRVWDPDDETRIDCSPTKSACAYQSPGNGHAISRLRVEPLLDPRTGSLDQQGQRVGGTRPWDIVAMPGCRGTSALPADNGVCFPPLEGPADIYIQVRYRPILAVTYKGSYGGPLNFSISGGPGTNYQGSGSGFACYPNLNPQTGPCATHLTAGQPVRLAAPSTVQAALAAVSPPCGGANCEFTLTADTCIEYDYMNGDPTFFQTVPLSPITCPTGPGTPGGGGGGGGDGGGPKTPEPIPEIKQFALEQIRVTWERLLYPCLVLTGGIAAGATGPNGILAGAVLVSASSPVCSAQIKRIQELQLIYQDPPRFDFHRVTLIRPAARTSLPLPACKDFSGSERGLCRQLGKAVARQVAKEDRATAIVEALRSTIEKSVGAFQANDERALKRQLKAARKRKKQLDAALAARTKAGARLAALLRGAGTTVTLTEAQYAQASEIGIAKLAELGLAEQQARTLLEPVLTPKALDVLAVLGQQ